VEYLRECEEVSIRKKNSYHLSMRSPATRKGNDETPMTGSQIITTANHLFRRRLVDQLEDDGEEIGNEAVSNTLLQFALALLTMSMLVVLNLLSIRN
jgi:hypothetical protein